MCFNFSLSSMKLEEHKMNIKHTEQTMKRAGSDIWN